MRSLRKMMSFAALAVALCSCTSALDDSKKLNMEFYSDYDGVNYEQLDKNAPGCEAIGTGYVVRDGAGITVPTTFAVPSSSASGNDYRTSRQTDVSYSYSFDGWQGYYELESETSRKQVPVFVKNGYPHLLKDESSYASGWGEETNWTTIIKNETELVKSATLFAHFVKTKKEYSVSLVDRNKDHVVISTDGDGNPVTVAKVKHGETLPSEVFTSMGYLSAIAPYMTASKAYDFKRWYVNDGSSKVTADPHTYVITSNTVFYAEFDEGTTRQFNVGFSFKNASGETVTTSADKLYGTNLDADAKPSSFTGKNGADTYQKDGKTYTFSKWSGTYDGGSPFDRFLLDSVSLTAVYKEETTKHNVAFYYYDTDGVTPVEISKSQVYHGTVGVVAPKTISKDGYVLKAENWKASGVEVEDLSTYEVTADVSFYKHIAKETVTQTHDNCEFTYKYIASKGGYSLSKFVADNATYANNSLVLGSSGVSFFASGSAIEGEPLVALEENVLRYNMQIKAITFPDSIKYLGAECASGILYLSSVALPSSLLEIGAGALSSNANLTSIVLPNGLITIGGRAFSGDISVSSISIPSSVASVGDRVFFGWDSASVVNVAFKSSEIPVGFSSIWDEVDINHTKIDVHYAA